MKLQKSMIFLKKIFFSKIPNFFWKNFFLMFETKIQLMLSQRVFIRFKSYRAQNFRNWLYFVNLLKNLKSCGLNKPKINKIDFGLFYIFLWEFAAEFCILNHGKVKIFTFWKVQENPEKSRVLALKSDKNSQSYNEITKINDFSPLYPPNLRQSIILHILGGFFGSKCCYI